MKTHVLHWATLQNFFIRTSRYGKYSKNVNAVEPQNKIQKQLKHMLLKDLYHK